MKKTEKIKPFFTDEEIDRLILLGLTGKKKYKNK
jgi:hypothetical protein